jgi:hypothetical protein
MVGRVLQVSSSAAADLDWIESPIDQFLDTHPATDALRRCLWYKDLA